MTEPVGRDGRDETVRIMNRWASREEVDGLMSDECMRNRRDRRGLRGLLLISSHFIDLPSRVRSPAAEAGRKAGIWAGMMPSALCRYLESPGKRNEQIS